MGEHNNTHRTEEELHSDIVSNNRGNSQHNDNEHEESNSVSPSVIDVEASVVSESVSKAVSDDVKENADDAVDYFSHHDNNHDSNHDINHDNVNSVDKESNDVTSAQHNEHHNEQHSEHSEHNVHVANVDYDNKNSIDNDANDEQNSSSVHREIVLVNDTNDIEQIETDDISDDYLIRPDKPTYMPRYLAMLAKTIIAVKGTLKAWRYQNSITYIEGLLYEEISEDRRDFLTDLRNEKQGELKELRTTMKDLLSLPSNQIVNEKYKQTLMLVDDNTDIKK